jgi:hypothetical protein
MLPAAEMPSAAHPHAPRSPSAARFGALLNVASAYITLPVGNPVRYTDKGTPSSGVGVLRHSAMPSGCAVSRPVGRLAGVSAVGWDDDRLAGWPGVSFAIRHDGEPAGSGNARAFATQAFPMIRGSESVPVRGHRPGPRQRDCLKGGMDAQLGQDVLQMRPDRVRCQVQSLGDLKAAVPIGQAG